MRPSVHDLFTAALTLPAEARAAYVAQRCADTGVRTRVLALLERHTRLGQFLELPDVGLQSYFGLAPGTRFGDFLLEAYQGHGGRGVVFRARQPSVGDRVVALKVVPLLRVDGRGRDRARREAESAAEVVHPHLVEVYAAGEDTARHLAWCAMRFVEGPTLQDVLDHLAARGRPPQGDERRELVARIAEIGAGLGKMHAAGLVHRDVKPANILLEGGTAAPPWQGPAVLVDFGLARRTDASGSLSTVLATPAYSAPEQLEGRRVGAVADVYALGLTLRQLLLGRSPRQGGPPDPRPTPVEPAALDAVIARATSAAPEDRYADAGALADDLARWLAGQPVAVPRRVGERRARGPGRLPRRLLGGALVAAGLVGVAAWGGAAWRQARAVQAAWQRGDLAAVGAARPALSWPAKLLLPGEIAHQARYEAQVGDVPARAAADLDAGLLRAAALLERDGAGARPALVRFLAANIRADQRPDAPALRLAARLLFERPAATAADVVGWAPIAAALRERLDDERPLARGYAAAGLGGGGHAADIALLLDRAAEWALDPAADDSGIEDARVATEAALGLLRLTSRRDGVPPSCDPVGFGLAVLERRGRGALPRSLAEASSRLLVEWVLALRRVGWPDPRLQALAGTDWSPELRAAVGQPGATAELLAAGPDFIAWPLAAGRLHERAVALGWDCERFGRRVGLLPADGVVDRGRRRVVAAAAEVRLDPVLALQRFERGVEIGRQWAAGDLGEDGPDPDSRLRVLLSPAAWTAPAVAYVPAAPKRVVAVLERDPPEVHSAARPGLRLLAASRDEEPGGVPLGYVRLSCAGRSAIQLDFDVPGLAGIPAAIELVVQKASRRRLPHMGWAAVDILLDGALIHRAAAPSTTRRSIQLALASRLAPGPHRIQVRLAAGSDTTLRVYRVGVELE